VSKRLSSPYRSGRSTDWLKIKNPDSPAMIRAREGSTVWTAVLVIARWPSQPWIAEGSISTALPEQLLQPREVDRPPRLVFR
jgi:ATP-dependent DNA ligase